MRRGGWAIWTAAALLAAAPTAQAEGDPKPAKSEKKSQDDLFRFSYEDYYRVRGQYLVNIVFNCGYCHTPLDKDGQIDRSRYLSGNPAGKTDPSNTAFETPWGRVFAPNITPDKATGIGEWDRDRFVNTVSTGLHGKDDPERWIFLPMPWLSIRNLPRDDIEAIWEFIRSVPPVENKAPAPIAKKK